MNTVNAKRTRGFSLIELVIVVVIIAIIGAIAIPRMSRGAAGAADSALTANVSQIRKALDLYAAEHGGSFPTAASFVAALTTYSDSTGATNATKTATFIYGPYLRAVPTLPVGAEKGGTTVAAAAATGVAWIYDATAGTVTANCADAEVDVSNKKYNTY